jgi:hypothetical protein
MAKAAKEALRRRIAPGVSLTLDLTEDDGSKFQRTLKLSFDFNAMALVHERTGVDMANTYPFNKVNLAPPTLSVMLWAAILANHPEYEGEEGLGVLRSYMDGGNVDQIEQALFDAWLVNLPEADRKMWLKMVEDAKGGANPTPAAPAPEPR